MPTWNVLLAFALTAFAGLSTGIGSAIAFFSKKTNKRFLSAALGFSAGVMLYLSFVEILAKASAALVKSLGSPAGHLGRGGQLLRRHPGDRADRPLVPSYENPHEARRSSTTARSQRTARS